MSQLIKVRLADILSAARLVAPLLPSASAASSPHVHIPAAAASVALGLLNSSGSALAPSLAGIDMAIPSIGRIVLSLAELCSYVDTNRALQLARVVSTECYSEDVGGILHRFLVVELRLLGRKTVWLRLDRRMGRNVSVWKFLWASGETDANDIAQLTASKPLATENGVQENRQKFDDQLTFQNFRQLLSIVVEEVTTYQIWPANCWFFCSLIQDRLGALAGGSFEFGSSKHGDLSPDVTQRVESRFHTIEEKAVELTLSEKLSALQDDERIADATLQHTEKALALSLQWDTVQDLESSYGKDLCETLVTHLCTLYLDLRTLADDAQFIREKCISLATDLHSADPRRRSATLACSLHRLGATIHIPSSACVERGMCAAKRGIIEVQTQLYNTSPECTSIDLPKCLMAEAARLESEGFLSSEHILTIRGEAVALQYALYELDPLVRREELVDLLASYGDSLHAAQQFENACAAKEDCLSLRRLIAASKAGADGDAERSMGLAGTLTSLGVSMYESKRYEDACAAHGEAVGILRALCALDPTRYREPLGQTLISLASSLGKAKLFSRSCEVTAEAVEIQRRLYEADGDRHWSNLALFLDQYGITLHAMGKYREECDVKQEAVQLARSRHQISETTETTTLLARLCFSSGMSLEKAGDTHLAVQAKEEAVELQRRVLRDTHSGQQIARLIKYLRGLGKTLDRMGRPKDAEVVAADVNLLLQLGVGVDESETGSSAPSRLNFVPKVA